MKTKIKNIVVFLLLGITIYLVFRGQNIDDLMALYHQSNITYIMIALVCMFLFWGIEVLLIYMLLKKVASDGSVWTCIKTTLIGQYYSLITPFATGGQPVQLYILKKGKIPYSKGTVVLVGKFLLFQITITLYGLIFFMYQMYHGVDETSLIFNVVLTALSINAIGLIIITVFSFKPILVNSVIQKIITILKKFHVIKNEDIWIEKCSSFLDEYKTGLQQLGQNIMLTITMFIISIIQITVLFSITYFVYKSLGLNNTGYINIISLQALLYMSVAFIPTPGTIGASEAGFYLILGSVFPQKMIIAALLLWRGISYYFGLIFCGGFTLFNSLLEKKVDY